MSALRWGLSLVGGFVFTSGLNWFVAEKVLNPIIRPSLGGLMRTGADTQIGVLTGGFALIVAVVAVLTAIADSLTVIDGAVAISFAQHFRRGAPGLATRPA